MMTEKRVREAKSGQRVPVENCIKLGRSYYLKQDYSKAMLDRLSKKLIGKPKKVKQ